MAEVIVGRVQVGPRRSAAELIHANDNVPETITPDDTRFFVALGLICVGVVLLAAYSAIGGPDDLMTVLRK